MVVCGIVWVMDRTPSLFAEERRHRIKEILLQDGRVRVADLVQLFNVSDETIRRDLDQLVDEGIVQRSHGGAVLVETVQTAIAAIPPVHLRTLEYSAEKDAIGRAAASLVGDGQTVIIDAGSTTWNVARHLQSCRDVTIITNSLDVAQECAKSPYLSIHMIGGRLIPRSMCLVGPQAEKELRRYHADISILGATGISLDKGFACTDIFEAETKRAMAESADRVAVVADHSKLHKRGLVSFAHLEDVDLLISSALVEPTVRAEYAAKGVAVVACPIGEPCLDELAAKS